MRFRCLQGRPPPGSARLPKVRVALALLWLTAGGGPVRAEAPGPASEYELKAAFVLNLVRFVEWPADAPTGRDAAMQLCLIGRDPFASAWQSMDDQRVHGRPLRLRQLAGPEEVAACHIVFVARSEAPRLRAVLLAIGSAPVLTVSDIEGFAEAGGAVGMQIADHRLQFDANWATLQRAGLRMSAAALRLARNVIGMKKPSQD